MLLRVPQHHDSMMITIHLRVCRPAIVQPEEAIPDLPENQAAREFLKSAPSRGLWMPLGREVKVMQCWRCVIPAVTSAVPATHLRNNKMPASVSLEGAIPMR